MYILARPHVFAIHTAGGPNSTYNILYPLVCKTHAGMQVSECVCACDSLELNIPKWSSSYKICKERLLWVE